MENLVNAVRGSAKGAFKGMAQLYNQLKNLPLSQLPGHVEKFQNMQRQLGKDIQQYEDDGCGDPPTGISQWVTMPLQPVVQQRLDLINMLNNATPEKRPPPGHYWILPVIPIWLEELLGGLLEFA
jgi:hypothetical protein